MATQNTSPSKKTVDFLYSGLVAFYPRTIFGEKVAKSRGVLSTWSGMQSSDFALLVTNITTTDDVDDAAKIVLSWKDGWEKNEYPDATIPKNLDELVQDLEENSKQKGKEAQVAIIVKQTLLESQVAKEKEQIKVETKPEPLVSRAVPTKEPGKILTTPIAEAPSTEPTQTIEQPGIVLQAITKTNIKPIGRVFLGVSTLPFRMAAPRIAGESPQGQVKATAQHMLYTKHITSSSLVGARPKAVALGINPKAFDNLLKEIANQERAYPGLYRRIASGFGVQEIIIKTGVPQAVAGQIFLSPSSEAGALVMPRRSFFGNFLARAGKQVFGGLFKGIAKKEAVAGAATKLATTVAKLEPHVRVAAWIMQGLSAIVNFFKGKSGDKSGVGGTLATVGFLAGGFLLLPVFPLLGALSLGAGGLTGLGLAANKAGGYGNLGAQAGGFGQTALTGLTAVVVPALAGPILFALIGIPIIIALILFIINSGAYIVPPTSLSTAIDSPYIGIEKEASPNKIANISGSQTINYSVRIYAKKGTLTNIKISNDYKVISESNPPIPEPQVDAINNPPKIISPVEDFTFEYQLSLDDRYNDSIVVDSITVVADVSEQADAEARISASVVIGNPPISCPLPGQSVNPRHASYTPGDESGGHGSADYWNRMGGSACRYAIPQKAPGCANTNDPRAERSGNPCYSASGCSAYGYAIDVFGSPGSEVFLPTIEGKTVDWRYVSSFSNGSVGNTHIYSSGQYYVVLTHLAADAKKDGSLPSGTVIGKLHPQGGNTHVHIEFSVGGKYVRPEEYFCF